MSCIEKYKHTKNGLIQEKIYLKSGYDLTISIGTGVAGEATCIIFNDGNLYQDSDSRSLKHPEFLIPIHDTEELRKIQKLIKKCLKERKKTLIK